MLTQQEAKQLVMRSAFERRRPTKAFIASRIAARNMRRLAGEKVDPEDWLGIWQEFLPMAGAASFFNVVLDTQAPQGASLALNGGAGVTTVQAITARANTTDNPATGYQIKIWGSVDTAVNASIQATEGASSWITPTWTNGATSYADQAVTVSSGDGVKTINMKIRDDVWNETTTLTQTIDFNTEIPTISILSGPDVTKVSTVSGKRQVTVTWEPDIAIDQYEVALVANSGSARGSGTVIANGSGGSSNVSGGAVAAAADITTVVDGRDIQTAAGGPGNDGTKVLKIFGRNADNGLWSG